MLVSLEIVGESSQSVPGADFGGILSDFPTPVRGRISPRLFVARRKTGYLALSTGSGDYVRDISGVIGSGPGTGICRTSLWGCRTARLTKIFATAKTIFFSPNSPYEIDRKRYKIILGIRYDNSNKMDFHEKIAFSTLQDNLQKWTGKSVLQTRKSVLQEYNVL